ncbi:MAG: hypothetical protein AB4038_16840 [Prochloraceae cyanobacterium]
MNSLHEQRIESLKTGILAACAFGVAYSMTVLVNSLILTREWEIFAQLPKMMAITLPLRAIFALASGFLFGVTYRYIIAADPDNSHLKDGAVIAFALVRGLAFIEISDHLSESFYILVLLGIESIFCFTLARLSLDAALERNWIKPF